MRIPLILMFIGLLTACSSNYKSATIENIHDAQLATTNQKSTLDSLGKTVDGLSPQNVTSEKPKAQSQVSQAKQENTQIDNALKGAAKGAVADQKVIESAKPDPFKVWLLLAAIALLVGGVISVVAGFFLGNKLPVIAPWLRSGGATAIIAGIFLAVIVRWLTAIYWACLIAGGVCIGVWIWLHRKEIIPGIKKVTQLNLTLNKS